MAVEVLVSTSNLHSYLTIIGIDTKSPNSYFLMRAIQALWRTNVKRFFSRTDMYYRPQVKFGGLHHSKGTDIRDVFHCEIRKGMIVGVIDTSDANYIRYLIHGAPPGSGAYIPALGGRVKRGEWRGLPSIYWTTWQAFFRNEVYSLVQQYGFEISHPRRKKKSNVKQSRAAEVAKVRNAVRGLKGVYNGII